MLIQYEISMIISMTKKYYWSWMLRGFSTYFLKVHLDSLSTYRNHRKTI